MPINEITEKYALSGSGKAELESYIGNRFAGVPELTEQDTSFLARWEEIVSSAEIYGAASTINIRICPKRPVTFNSPDTVKICMYDSFAGRIPIIYVRDTSDFEQLVTNIAYKGIRPDNLSQTGASFISGKTTRLIVLSSKPYSNIPASELGIDDAGDWAEKSMLLRRGHECTHYFTKQTYGITNNILHDEIMADFIGMYEAFGCYKAEWFLRFMGVIAGSGGRLVFYTKDLSDNVRQAVTAILTAAADNLEQWSQTEQFAAMTVSGRIKYMCRIGLAGMAEKTCGQNSFETL